MSEPRHENEQGPEGYGQQPGYGQPDYEQPPSYGQDPYAQPPSYGQDPYAQNPYPGQNPYGHDPYGQAGYPPAGYASGGWPVPQGGTPTLDQPWYGIGPVDAVKRALQKYARFDGRASRSEYWWFVLATGVLSLVFYIPFLALVAAADNRGADDVPGSAVALMVVGILVGVALVVPSIAITVRRLHDAGFSGLLYLLNLVPYLGSLVVLVLTILPSRPEGARYDRRTGQPGYPGYPQ